MSRVANSPVEVPAAVNVTLNGQDITVKGSNGTLALEVHELVEVSQKDNVLTFAARKGAKQSRSLAGTMRALVDGMVTGVSQGFEKKVQLVGVCYRVRVQGKTVNLSLGFSEPVNYTLPEGVKAEDRKSTRLNSSHVAIS